MTDSPTTRHTASSVLTRRRGGTLTDVYVRLAGVLGVVGIAIALLAPQFADLVAYVAFAMWFNGPQSAVVPASFEPVLLLYGQLYPPLVIAALGTAANLVIEALNYRLFAAAIELNAVKKAGDTRVVRWLTRVFARAPFVAVTVAAAGLPLWVARVLVVMSHYPIGRHLAATALGRFPRFWFIAALGGAVGIPPHWLMAVVGASLIVTAVLLASRHVQARQALDAAGAEVVPAPID